MQHYSLTSLQLNMAVLTSTERYEQVVPSFELTHMQHLDPEIEEQLHRAAHLLAFEPQIGLT